jgi:hypothetical protein
MEQANQAQTQNLQEIEELVSPRAKRPAYVKWIALAGIVVFVAAAILSVVLLTKEVTYGLSLKVSDVDSIRVYNAHTAALPGGYQYLESGRSEKQDARIQTIIDLVNKGGKSDEFSRTFLGHGGNERPSNSSGTRETQVRTSTFIEIIFKEATFKVVLNAGAQEIQPYDAANPGPRDAENRITSILIPLERVTDSFQTQEWYFHRGDHSDEFAGSQTFDRLFTTYGNYLELADYIRDEKKINFNGLFYSMDAENTEEA